LLRAIERLSKNNIKTSIRWQPYIPYISEDPTVFVKRVTSVGIKHLALEHLKLSMEKNNPLVQQVLLYKKLDLNKLYKQKNCHSDGREFVLPPWEKIGVIKYIKSELAGYKTTFGAADNEFQYLSDTFCCCSGADQFNGFENWNKFQIAYAVKKSNGSEISFDLIKDEWSPQGSIDKHLNSKSRIPVSNGHNTVSCYIKERWENLKSPFNPTSFWGVVYKGKVDKNNMKIYDWDSDKLYIL